MNTNGEVLINGLIKAGYTQNAAENTSHSYLQYGTAFLSELQIKDCKKVFRNERRKTLDTIN